MAQHSHAPRRVAGRQNRTPSLAVPPSWRWALWWFKSSACSTKSRWCDIIGDQGSADFYNAYNIYAVLLTISTAGLPVAVSKLVSEASATGRHNQVRRVFRLSLALFWSGCAVLPRYVLRSGPAGRSDARHQAAPGIRALAPGGHLCGLSVRLPGLLPGPRQHDSHRRLPDYRGPVQAGGGLGLAYWLVKAGADQSRAAAGAITGVTVGTIVALAYMLLNYLMGRSREGLAGTYPGLQRPNH